MNSKKAEICRLKYKYRELILRGKIVLPHKEASLLIGPDCAYHLYSLNDYDNNREAPRSSKTSG
jgi:hypothetical protein